MLDAARLLFDLQRSSEIAQHLSGCLEPEAIAKRVTDGLVEKFDCAFARIWLVESDQSSLRLVASSGMYTHVNGSFARVPMGAFKVGKIAQNRVSFLSNNLPHEPWVKDRAWAIANNICGFAGYPLAIENHVVGVLAVFSHNPMEPEFLEILQNLCTTVTLALETALRYHQEKQGWHVNHPTTFSKHVSLSDQLASNLVSNRLTLVGTERPLSFSVVRLFLHMADVLNQMNCSYCRLTYGKDQVTLEAIVAASSTSMYDSPKHIESAFGDLVLSSSCLGGRLDVQVGPHQRVIQISLSVPYLNDRLGPDLQIQCQQPVLQMAFTHLAYLAGLTVSDTPNHHGLLLTDSPAKITPQSRILWIQQGPQAPPKGIDAQLDLSISPTQLREAVDAVIRGETWGVSSHGCSQSVLSDREQEIMSLLAQGLRDRDIANQLFISESTVKFHINNILTKLKARNRYQAVYQATLNGWISTSFKKKAIAD